MVVSVFRYGLPSYLDLHSKMMSCTRILAMHSVYIGSLMCFLDAFEKPLLQHWEAWTHHFPRCTGVVPMSDMDTSSTWLDTVSGTLGHGEI